MRRSSTGQSVVEFALVAPIFFAVLFGIIASGYLFFQASAINDAAQGGAREALVETSLDTSGAHGLLCESGSPRSIEAAVQQAANILPINPNPLCNYGGGSTLTQIAVAGDASITVSVTGSLANPATFTVAVNFIAHPLEPLLGTSIHLKGISTLEAQPAP